MYSRACARFLWKCRSIARGFVEQHGALQRGHPQCRERGGVHFLARSVRLIEKDLKPAAGVLETLLGGGPKRGIRFRRFLHRRPYGAGF